MHGIQGCYCHCSDTSCLILVCQDRRGGWMDDFRLHAKPAALDLSLHLNNLHTLRTPPPRSLLAPHRRLKPAESPGIADRSLLEQSRASHANAACLPARELPRLRQAPQRSPRPPRSERPRLAPCTIIRRTSQSREPLHIHRMKAPA